MHSTRSWFTTGVMAIFVALGAACGSGEDTAIVKTQAWLDAEAEFREHRAIVAAQANAEDRDLIALAISADRVSDAVSDMMSETEDETFRKTAAEIYENAVEVSALAPRIAGQELLAQELETLLIQLDTFEATYLEPATGD